MLCHPMTRQLMGHRVTASARHFKRWHARRGVHVVVAGPMRPEARGPLLQISAPKRDILTARLRRPPPHRLSLSLFLSQRRRSAAKDAAKWAPHGLRRETGGCKRAFTAYTRRRRSRVEIVARMCLDDMPRMIAERGVR